MTGKEFIEKICERLRDKDIRLYDSHIRQEIEEMRADDLKELILKGDVTLWKNQRAKLRSEKPLSSDMDWQDLYSDAEGRYS
jgi:hypothetical protein